MAIFWSKKRPSPQPAEVKALLFDTFGTTVDWLSSLTSLGNQIGAERGIQADWAALARDWRAHYKPAIKPIREGKRPWTGFDTLHREQLDGIISKHGAAKKLSSADRDRLTHGWHQLAPWPDVVPGLHRLKKHFILGPLRQMVDLARFGNLPWDVVFGADMFRTYKPDPKIYLGAAAYLGLAPEMSSWSPPTTKISKPPRSSASKPASSTAPPKTPPRPAPTPTSSTASNTSRARSTLFSRHTRKL